MNILAAAALALAPMGADHPSTPVFNDGWSKGVAALVNDKSRVHGYFVNWTDVFFFNGTASEFNRFVKDYSKIPGERLRLIIHFGKLKVMSPGDTKPRGLNARWRLTTNSVKIVDPKVGAPEKQLLELWVRDGISERDIVVPRNIEVQRRGRF